MPTPTPSPSPPPPTAETGLLERLVPEVVAVYPHDPNAFTQGLLWHDGFLYESTGIGRYEASSLRQVDLESGEVVRHVPVAPPLFGEGLALVDDRLIQLTWRNQIALVYDLATLEQIETLTYEGEGWGLCFADDSVWMTNGSATLTERDPSTLAPLSTREITQAGTPGRAYNELECVGESIYANIWHQDIIVRFDRASGEVTAVIDASNLLTAAERMSLQSGQVLNGIAFDSENDLFYLTGKEWPWLFAVRFVSAPAD